MKMRFSLLEAARNYLKFALNRILKFIFDLPKSYIYLRYLKIPKCVVADKVYVGLFSIILSVFKYFT